MTMFDTDTQADRDFFKSIRLQKQAYADLAYEQRLSKMKKALTGAAFLEKPNNLVEIRLKGKLFYCYPHKNLFRQQGVTEWSKASKYTKIVELILKLTRDDKV